MENPMNKWMIWGVKSPPLFLVQHPYGYTRDYNISNPGSQTNKQRPFIHEIVGPTTPGIVDEINPNTLPETNIFAP